MLANLLTGYAINMNISELYTSQLVDKQLFLSDLLAPFYTNEIRTFESPPKHFRMRAEFRIWHDGDDTFHIMFNQDTKEQYRVDSLPAASVSINLAMQLMTQALQGNQILRHKLFQIDYLSTTTDEVLISMIYHRQLDDQWIAEVTKLRKMFSTFSKIDFVGRAKKQKIMVDSDFVNERLLIAGRHYTFKQIENSFTQPNALVNVKMIEWAMSKSEDAEGDLLELYCGAGNFSIPLACKFDKVMATEISKTSVNAAQINIQQNAIENLSIVRLSSEEFVQAMRKERVFNRLAGIDIDSFDFQTVLVDPPRSGLDDETIKLISMFKNIIYISCNPNTLKQNLLSLITTHTLVDAVLFDQFPFTPHIETGVFLQRR